MRRWVMSRAACALVFAVLLVAGCSVSGGAAGPDTTAKTEKAGISPDDWAKEFCGSLRSTLTDLKKYEASFKAEIDSVSSIAGAKKVLVDLIDRIRGRFAQDRYFLRADQMPDVEGAVTVRDKLGKLFDNYLGKLKSARDSVAAAPVDDPKGFTAMAEEASRSLSLNSLGGAVTGDDPNLKFDPTFARALSKECSNLGN